LKFEGEIQYGGTCERVARGVFVGEVREKRRRDKATENAALVMASRTTCAQPPRSGIGELKQKQLQLFIQGREGGRSDRRVERIGLLRREYFW
jgi:hypothetical protein